MPRLAEKIGSLLFCPDCGTLLNLPQDEDMYVKCEQCGHEEPASSYENIEIVTRSHPDAFPSPLRQKGKTQTKVHEANDALLKVTEKCPECGHMEAFSREMQLRSADEGSTIFYTCVKCKYGWRVNN
ncbi:DNA-directed RNA polymerase I kDa polypeptide [Rhodofomes roseus]|uniref:DNA-directed RNA polymerase subunit n=1 Tax=Rhodofomes roseus TaxID=34475 RepID=A0ABQ8KG62_9APHY|nr:DNA-directed RNA polymerase I kDa polypeptide [Rhodofomes roseus]KAH9836661.1 DNA-directed RNA polymerase I kDa polypeptide [Rhodofomes roseus]